jgi:hypothetical protein
MNHVITLLMYHNEWHIDMISILLTNSWLNWACLNLIGAEDNLRVNNCQLFPSGIYINSSYN